MKRRMMLLGLMACCGIFLPAMAQKTAYHLPQLLRENRLVALPSNEVTALTTAGKPAVSMKGIVWLKGVNFKQGTIEIDLRGKDVFLKSFLGIAFHGVDTTTCDILYFRPFNFRHEDTLRRKWSVAYMSLPDKNYAVLRRDHPLVYENAVDPVPRADEWFHATLVLIHKTLSVYVNHSAKPSLQVTLLNDRTEGLFGLYSDGLPNDFANLTITPRP
ncbi:hypothetical protein [Larkinella rosea]|uniref:DUF1080 domain-containing protein n=1 Tax=Larkinella rosea TaxID=2025312 RepID=A0A3P1C347_9BACT|nr:hypothetical protein [Larkinella rosea]RRB07820.1 hypothetical protein EHT25_08610 [Larkinella rosea]